MANQNQSQQQTATTQSKAVTKYENISEQVLDKIEKFQADGGLVLPNNYSVENHMKSAWLILQSTKDRNQRPALEVCTKDSIANALFDMVLQGLAVSKNQGYFIVYGDKLEFQRSYFGTIALAKRAGGMQGEPVANIIYEGDNFVYEIDPMTGLYKVIKHEQKIENIDNAKIKAAYAIVTRKDGTKQVTIMSIQQIHAAWQQGATKGSSPAHKNFSDEMAKKTVIGRACKMIINSSDDAWLYDGKSDEMDVDKASRQREAAIASEKPNIIDANYEDVTGKDTAEKPAIPAPTPAPAQAPSDEPGY